MESSGICAAVNLRIRGLLLGLLLTLEPQIVFAEPPIPVAQPTAPREWSETGGYVPANDVEGSGLAFDDDGRLYLLSEGHGVLLRFSSAQDTLPKVIPLQIPDSRRNAGKGGFDLEAICIVGDEVYVCDEHTLRIYVCRKSDGRLLEDIRIAGEIDQRPTGRRKADGTRVDGSQKSIEGLVVRKNTDTGEREFLMLDEHDEVVGAEQTTYVSRVYRGTLPAKQNADPGFGEQTLSVRPVASFLLGTNEFERFTELMEYGGQLYAIRSVRTPVRYSVVRLSFGKSAEESTYRELLCWQLASPEYSSNFEGATILPDGRLFVCTDGPGFRKGSWRQPRPVPYRTLLAEYGRIGD